MSNSVKREIEKLILDRLKKSVPVLSDVFCVIDKLLLTIAGPLTIDNLADYYAKGCDKVIIEAKKSEKLEYVYGKLTASLRKNSGIQFSAELYFQNPDGKWIKKTMESSLIAVGRFHGPSVEELTAGGDLSFEINPPDNVL